MKDTTHHKLDLFLGFPLFLGNMAFFVLNYVNGESRGFISLGIAIFMILCVRRPTPSCP
jgi:hypothetical protein